MFIRDHKIGDLDDLLYARFLSVNLVVELGVLLFESRIRFWNPSKLFRPNDNFL